MNQSAPEITAYLSRDRIILNHETTSRKRLFEYIAEVTTKGQDSIDEDCVFKTIAERERLGSTGLGKGIAVPHGRLENLEEPIITMVRLKHPVDYDAPDDQPIWLAMALLVPQEASDMHLKLLATLASCFQNEDFITALKDCNHAAEVSELFDQTQNLIL